MKTISGYTLFSSGHRKIPLFLFCFFLSLCFSSPPQTHATEEEPLRTKPAQTSQLPAGFICTGFDSSTRSWGWNQFADRWNLCPPHHAIFGTSRPFESSDDYYANCCPLPSDDILTAKHITVASRCPDGFVVTGIEPCSKPTECIKHLRCTQINSKKYLLGEPHRGIHWGVNVSTALPWKERKMIRFDELPAAIRYGISRVGKLSFSPNGCVGAPAGSLFVGRLESSCKGLLWRKLFTLSSIEDAASPTAMFPDCTAIDDPLSPEPNCEK